MALRVEKADYDPECGFLYYVAFKPNLGIGVQDVKMSAQVEAACSLTENAELADLTFIVPQSLRTREALAFICADEQSSYCEPHVYLDLRGRTGDTAVQALGRLDLDLAGRIVGMAIQWQPVESSRA